MTSESLSILPAISANRGLSTKKSYQRKRVSNKKGRTIRHALTGKGTGLLAVIDADINNFLAIILAMTNHLTTCLLDLIIRDDIQSKT